MRVVARQEAEGALSEIAVEMTLENVGADALLLISEDAVRFELAGGSPPPHYDRVPARPRRSPWATARRLAAGEKLTLRHSPTSDAGGYWRVGAGLITVASRYERHDTGPAPEALLVATGQPRVWAGTLTATPLLLRSTIEDEGYVPNWLKKRPGNAGDEPPGIPSSWFNEQLPKVFAGARHIRILQDGKLVGTESSPGRIAALLESLEFGGPYVGRPGGGCRCLPSLHLEVYTASGADTISPVCANRLRLGTLETGIKWPDPYLTPAALDAFKRWVEEHGADWKCCGGP